MPTSFPFRTLLTQFQSRYPMGCLTADLLTIHQEQYVVRATAKLGDTILATGMSSAPEIETAEDRAKVRTLEALGLGIAGAGSTSPFADALLTPPLPVPEQPISQNSVVVSAKQDRFSPAVDATEPDGVLLAASQPIAETKPSVSKGFSHAATVTADPSLPASATLANSEFGSDLMSSVEEEPITASDTVALPDTRATDEIDHFAFPTHLPASNHVPFSSFELSSVDSAPVPGATATLDEPGSVKPEKAGKSTKRKASTFEPPPAPPSRQPADRSEEIMKIGIEMKRLGWSTEQGREYLKRTYGKRSRQELDDAELLDFLRYLETQPAAVQAPF